MSIDYSARFATRRFATRPAREQLFLVLTDYLGGGGAVDRREPAFWVVTLVGTYSHPCRRVDAALIAAVQAEFAETPRAFSVFVWPDQVACVTYQADEFTQNVAAGGAQLIARRFGGTYEPPS